MTEIICGDVLEILKTLESESVQCVVTSPPYLGLRDYGTAQWRGGDEKCAHSINQKDADHKAVFDERVTRGNRENCLKCGAVRVDIQIGLEKTPEAFVAKLVEVFREVRRVLRADGTLWLNLGDSYANGAGGRGDGDFVGHHGKTSSKHDGKRIKRGLGGLKPKDLCGMPWRVAFALQADGWWLRQDIIWAKPNPMPESVTDRCTKSHEYIFLLTKSASYFYNAEAIKEPVVYSTEERKDRARESNKSMPTGERNGIRPKAPGKNSRIFQDRDPQHSDGRKMSSPAGWKTGPGSHGSIHEDGQEKNITWTDISPETRNKRSVWNIATHPYAGGHFATFPEEIPKLCIEAGTKEGDIVLDPFSGAGTTCMVAKKLNRKYIGIELNPKYVDIAERRIETECGTLF